MLNQLKITFYLEVKEFIKMIFNDTQYYKDATKKLLEFRVEASFFLMTELWIPKSKNSLSNIGFTAAQAGEALRKIFIELEELKVKPIGCRTLHFYRNEGKNKVCMYCNHTIKLEK